MGSMSTVLNINQAIELIGTNVQTFFIAYDVSSDDDTAIGRNFGLEVKSGAFGFIDGITDNFPQNSFISGSSTGPAPETNVSVSSLTARDWDFKVTAAVGMVPESVDISNMYAMQYFDIISDGQTPALELITNITYILSGNYTGLTGAVMVYRENSNTGTLSDIDDNLLVSLPLDIGQVTNSIGFSEGSISDDPLEPTRFWLAIVITNTDTAALDKTLGLTITDIMGTGPNFGVVTNSQILSGVTPSSARIDTYVVSVTAQTVLNASVKQKSYDNEYLQLSISNSDPDGTNFLGVLRLTNLGTAVGSDLGEMIIFSDTDQNGSFNAVIDQEVGSAVMNASKQYPIVFDPPLAVSGPSNLFFAAFNVKTAAVEHRTVALQVADTADVQQFSFIDNFNDDYTRSYQVTVPSTLPVQITTNDIISRSSESWDFYLLNVDYSSVPQSFTTNEPIAVASFSLFMDVENTNSQVLTSVDVEVAGQDANLFGNAQIFLETNGQSSFAVENCRLLSTVSIAGGNDISVPLDYSNVSIDSDLFYFVFTLTNDIAAAMEDTVSFRLQRFNCIGPNGGIITNVSTYTNQTSAVMRVDSGRILVSAITNFIDPTAPQQASTDNKYLKVVLQGEDPDSKHYLSEITVSTNVLSTVDLAVGQIPNVKIFDASFEFIKGQKFYSGYTNIILQSPLLIDGTNDTVFYIGYDVTGNSSVIGKTLGLKIPDGGLQFIDGISDGFPQVSFIDSNYEGPSVETNVSIQSFNYTYWDFNLLEVKNIAPVAIGISNVYIMTYFDLRADDQDPLIQFITNLTYELEGTAADVYGECIIYRDLTNIDTFNPAEDPQVGIGTISDPLGINTISLNENNLNTLASIPDKETRFWVGIRITNNDPDIFTNTVGLKINGIYADGPDGGVIENYFITNAPYTTNTTGPAAAVDSFSVSVSAAAYDSGDVRQGSTTNLAFSVEVINNDSDMRTYLQSLTVTNEGTSDYFDLGDLKVYIDTDSNGLFNSAVDTRIMRSSPQTNNSYVLSLETPVLLDSITNVLWFVYAVDLNGQTGSNIVLQIPNDISAIGFADIYEEPYIAGGYDQTSVIDTMSALPVSPYTNNIINMDQKAYHFYLKSAVYNGMPQSFSSNQLVPVAEFQVFRDVDNQPLVFEGIDVQTFTAGIKDDIYGFAYLYKEISNSGFSSADDELIGSNVLVQGQDFSIFTADSNITLDISEADVLYLAFIMTNDADSAKDNTISLKVTNFRCSRLGVPGVFTNLQLLSPLSSSTARVDNGKVQVSYISNEIPEFYPKQGIDNPYLKIVLSGDDADAFHSLKSITVRTNEYTDVLDSYIPAVKVYLDEGDSAFDKDTDFLKGSYALTGGEAVLAMSPSLTLTGTNEYTLFIAYDIATDTEDVIGRPFGLTIPSNSFVFEDKINDSFDQLSFTTGSDVGPLNPTNIIIAPATSRSWDFRLLDHKNAVPAAVSLSNLYPLAYVDIIRDGQSINMEILTNAVVALDGYNSAVYGKLYIYSDTNEDGEFSTADKELTNIDIADPVSLHNIPLYENSLSKELVNPTRLFLAVMITNNAPEIFTNTLSGRFVDLQASGPNNGLITDMQNTNNYLAAESRIDDFSVIAYIENYLTNDINRGSPNNLCFKLTLSNVDPDAVNGFSSLVVSNSETASNVDLGSFVLYVDNGDDMFNPGEDSIAMIAGVMGAGNDYNLTASPTVSFNNTANNVFWGAVNVNPEAYSNDVQFTITGGSSGITLTDIYADGYDQTPVLLNNTNIPGGLTVSINTSLWGEPYDIRLGSIDYTVAPHAFTAGQYAPVAAVRVSGDYEEPTNQFLTGLDLLIRTNIKPKDNLYGFAYVYKETSGNDEFDLSDKQVAVNDLTAGADVSFSFWESNISVYEIDTFYVVVRITNDLSNVMHDAFYVSVTNIRCYGPDGGSNGVITNTAPFYGLSSSEVRVDDQRVTINYVSNEIYNYSPNQSSINNPYIKLSVSGVDPDAQNFLSYIDVQANSYSTIDAVSILSVVVCTNVSNQKLSGQIGTKPFNNGIDAHIRMTEPYELRGTNEYILHVGYHISDDGSVVKDLFGLEMTNNAVGFTDGINDGFEQITLVTGSSAGPVPQTNIKISKIGARPFDLYVLQRTDPKNDPALISNVEMPLLYFDLLAEWQDVDIPEVLDSIVMANSSSSYPFSGTINIYTNSFLVNYFSPDWTPIVSSVVTEASNQIDLQLNLTNIPQYGVDDALRFFITYTADMFTNITTNVFSIAELKASGPNGGIVANSYYFSNYSVPATLLHDNRVTITIDSELSETIKRGDRDTTAAKITLQAVDQDASFNLEQLVFSIIDGTASPSDIASGQLYLDDGSGTSDGADVLVPGSAAPFSGSLLTTSMSTPIQVSASPTVLFLTVSIAESAEIGSTFRLGIEQTNQQNAFKQISIYLSNYNVEINTIIDNGGQLAEILPQNLIEEGKNSALLNNVIRTGFPDKPARIIAEEFIDLTKHKAVVYDITGVKIIELEPNLNDIIWDGMVDGKYVRSGMYIIITSGPEVNRTDKVVLKYSE
jgi:hypothetical protein